MFYFLDETRFCRGRRFLLPLLFKGTVHPVPPRPVVLAIIGAALSDVMDQVLQAHNAGLSCFQVTNLPKLTKTPFSLRRAIKTRKIWPKISSSRSGSFDFYVAFINEEN